MRAEQATVVEVDAHTVSGWLESGQARLIDVREPDEHARERIEGATLAPLSGFDAASLPRDGRTVFHCKGGRRSLEAAGAALAAGHGEVYSLKGGIDGWKAAGLPTRVNESVSRLSIMRQVQIVVGFAVLGGSVLAAIFSPWFLILTGFFGAGLLFAGLTGTCGLAAVLALMPWNRAASCSARR